MPDRIPLYHRPVVVDGTAHDLSHLNAFTATIAGKGLDVNTNLGVLVVFSNHVVTTRTKVQDTSHLLDHNGVGRSFDPDRYAMSLQLRAAIKTKIEANGLTFVSKSYSEASNLIFVETKDGRTWSVVFCLLPTRRRNAVRFAVLSCHAKMVDEKKVSKRILSVYARRCLLRGVRQP